MYEIIIPRYKNQVMIEVAALESAKLWRGYYADAHPDETYEIRAAAGAPGAIATKATKE